MEEERAAQEALQLDESYHFSVEDLNEENVNINIGNQLEMSAKKSSSKKPVQM